jgi:hypothetical protein
VKKNAQAVQEKQGHEKIGAPERNVADELPDSEPGLQAEDRIVGLRRNRLVGELQQHAGEELQRHQHRGDHAQTEGEREAQGLLRHHAGADVEDEGFKNALRAAEAFATRKPVGEKRDFVKTSDHCGPISAPRPGKTGGSSAEPT